MKSFKVGKIVFIVSYLILEIIAVLLIITTYLMLAEYRSNTSMTRELSVLIGFLFVHAIVYLFEVMYGFGIQQDESNRVLKTLTIAFLLNVFTIIAIFEYADISVLHGYNYGFLLYKTYSYIFISFNLVGFGANLYLIFNRF